MYYLPVNINGRRIHYCELRDEYDEQQTVFSFLVKMTDEMVLLTIDEESCLVSDSRGFEGNKRMESMYLSVGREGETIQLRMRESKFSKAEERDARGVVIVKDDDDNRSVCVRRRDVELGGELTLEIVFEEEREYKCRVSFMFCREEDVVKAALDFGSEASQIRIGGANTPLVKDMRNVANSNFAEGSEKYPDKDYMQGSRDDKSGFYKSLFWINLKPGTTRYGDAPMNNGEETMVQVLTGTGKGETKEFVPLPNLKLSDLVPGINANVDIEFDMRRHPETNVQAKNPSLMDREQQDNIMRMLITDFLHSLMHRVNENNQGRRLYLRFIVLVPNVFDQDKVYKTADNLYQDFHIIKGEGKYPSIKGMEVSVLSESDASFLGCCMHDKTLTGEKNSYYLIIDSGKGTTDFSIMKSTEDITKFESCYRCGIPASGNAITYSFFEALNDAIEVKAPAGGRKTIVDLVNEKESDYNKLLEMARLLDLLKINYRGYGKVALDEQREYLDITEVLTYLQNILDGRNLCLPNIDRYIYCKDSNINKLTMALRKSLEKYMSCRDEGSAIRFRKVVLTGRGFCFKPFADAVKEMLIEAKWVEGATDFITTERDPSLAKSICMEGAIQTVNERGVDVNRKSMLVGSPIIQKSSEPGILSRIRREKREAEWRYTELLNEDFYFKGARFKTSGNYKFLLNNKYVQGDSVKGEHYVYFVGRHFIVQSENRSEVLSFEDAQWDDGTEDWTEFVKKSLFPLNRLYNENAKLEGAGNMEPEEEEEEAVTEFYSDKEDSRWLRDTIDETNQTF